MKKYRLSILLALGVMASALLFHACQTEHTAPFTENVTDLLPDDDGEITFRSTGFDYSECQTLKSTVYKSGEMLVFQDKNHFEKCAICLEKEYDDYNDQYEAQYPNATPEDLDSLDALNNFNEWTPFIAFETLHGFSSYRAKIENDIQTWLDSTPAELFSAYDDPDNTSPVMDESQRALLNENGFPRLATILCPWMIGRRKLSRMIVHF